MCRESGHFHREDDPTADRSNLEFSTLTTQPLMWAESQAPMPPGDHRGSNRRRKGTESAGSKEHLVIVYFARWINSMVRLIIWIHKHFGRWSGPFRLRRRMTGGTTKTHSRTKQPKKHEPDSRFANQAGKSVSPVCFAGCISALPAPCVTNSPTIP